MSLDPMAAPNSFAEPLVAGRSPVSIFIVVDLPQPFEPRKPKISPRAMRMLTTPRSRRNRADATRAGCGKSRSLFRASARRRARSTGKILGAARGYEHGAAVARAREAG